MKNIKQYYKELGKVLYVIAMADGCVQTEEQEKIHELVAKELALHERSSDSSGMNQAFYVDFEFDDLAEHHAKEDDLVEHFNRFINDNLEPGDEALMNRSLKLMDSVANAYPRNKEQNIIARITNVSNSRLKHQAH